MRGVGAFARAEQIGGQAACQLHLMLNVAIIVEVPVEAILVVCNLHRRKKHLSILASHLTCMESRRNTVAPSTKTGVDSLGSP